MKTKTFLLVCLLFGIGLTQISAQNGKNGTGTTIIELTETNWQTDVYCDGSIVDNLSCPEFVLRIKLHYRNGEVVREFDKVTDLQATSLLTNETFKGEAGFVHVNSNQGYLNFHGNFIGDKGNKYTFNIKYDTSTWEMIDIRTNCHETWE